MTRVDQQTWRRIMKQGLTAYDREYAFPGYTLYSPANESKITLLIDMAGNEVHRWQHQNSPGLYGYLLPNGNLFYLGKSKDEGWNIFPPFAFFKGGLLQELDWNGNLIWQHHDPYHHHDARRTPSGGTIYLSLEKVPEDLEKDIKGGYDPKDNCGMWADVIVELDSEGNKIWEWSAVEHLDPKLDVISPNVPRWEWTHGNTVVPLDNDRVMFSWRHTSTVGIIDKNTNKIIWRLGDDVLAGQHDVQLLPNGNILVFDNGPYRKYDMWTYSRVLEINPKTNEIVWQYMDSPVFSFYSQHISGVQRLANGNTMICEGATGRIFQVTPDNKTVWEYINPHFEENNGGVPVNVVFRAYHYTEDQIPHL